MDSEVEMLPSDEEMVDDDDYYDYYSDMADDDGGIGSDSDGELGAGNYEGIEAEGSDVVISRREQVSAVYGRGSGGD
jgi:ariadne-1